MQWTEDTTDVPDSKRSGSTTMKFDWSVIRQTPSPSNCPTMLTTSSGFTAVSYLTEIFTNSKQVTVTTTEDKKHNSSSCCCCCCCCQSMADTAPYRVGHDISTAFPGSSVSASNGGFASPKISVCAASVQIHPRTSVPVCGPSPHLEHDGSTAVSSRCLYTLNCKQCDHCRPGPRALLRSRVGRFKSMGFKLLI